MSLKSLHEKPVVFRASARCAHPSSAIARRRMSDTPSRFAAGLCALSLAVLNGCGAAFSGGSVPVGRAVLTGRVVSAQDTTQAIASAAITAVATYNGTRRVTLQATSDAQGQFQFINLPTGSQNVSVQITIQAQDASLEPETLTFTLGRGRKAALIATLAPVALVSEAASVALSPTVPQTIYPAVQVDFSARVVDDFGDVLPLAPSLLCDGNFGSITPTGTFKGIAIGSGQITAFWYSNLESSPAPVTVSTGAGSLPPPPSSYTLSDSE